MKISIASGKGGTGKTTVATNLAYVASHNGQSVAYLDCDAQPMPVQRVSEERSEMVPHIDMEA